MVLLVLLGLNGQNNEDREKMGAKRLIKKVSDKRWSVASMNRLTKKIHNFGSTERKSGSGRPRSLCLITFQ